MSLSSIYLDAFFACAQTGNFTQAAERLHITQSAVSQRVLNLEKDLETALFIRDRAGIRLTEAGEELLRYCQAKSAIETDVLERVRSGANTKLTGIVRIGGYSSVMRSVVLPALAPLFAKNEDLKLQVISTELRELPNLLRRGEIDYMILHEKLEREDLETINLGEELNVMVEAKGYKGPEIYLDHDESDETTAKYLRQQNRRQKLKRRYLDDVYGLIDGVKLGLGRAVVPTHLIRGEKSIRVIDPDKVMKIPLMLHYFNRPYYPRLHHEVLAALTTGCPGYL